MSDHLPEALRRHQAGEAIVMPVILRACAWDYTPLADIQAYPEKAKPIKSWTHIDEAYTDVVRGVYLAATEIKKRRSQQQVAVEQAKLRQEQQRQAEQEKRQQQAEQLRQQRAAVEAARLERLEQQRQEQLKQEAENRRQQERAKQPPLLLTELFEFEVATITKGGFFKSLEVKRTRKRANCYREDLGNNIFLEMVAIPGGNFRMGSTESSDEQPMHEVKVAPFFLGKYPVTQAQWKAVAALPKVKLDLSPDPANFKGGNRPVEQVSWWEAMEFCDRLSRKTNRTYRLPSEAEWEYACRAGTTTPFHFGEIITADLANYDGSATYNSSPKGLYRNETTPVGSFGVANAFGLYDMHGNVWEWCADHWHEDYQGAPIDGSAWLTDNQEAGRLVRGGSWIYEPRHCRSAYRYYYYFPVYRDIYLGFRVVCVLA